MVKQLKPVPPFPDEAAERAFWESHDTTAYVDWSTAQALVLPKLKSSTATISLRLPRHVLDEIKAVASDHDVSYQTLINVWLKEKLHGR